MTVQRSPPELGKRRRRVHQKSRRGCGNCKLRRIKCDEQQPRCKKCDSYGVSCNYDSKSDSEDLQSAMNGAFVIEAPQRSPVSLSQTILSMINSPPSTPSRSSETTTSTFQLHEEDLRVVCRFQSRTILTIGTKETVHVSPSSLLLIITLFVCFINLSW